MRYSVSSGKISIEADSFGGELVSVKYNGKEKLWQNQDGTWKEHAPVLFPVCGSCKMVVNGKEYPILRHGFAKRQEFEFLSKTENSIRMRLTANAETLKAYPFYFEFIVEYSIEKDSLIINYTVRNADKDTIFYSLGGHESYMLNHNINECGVEFTEIESPTFYVVLDGYLEKVKEVKELKGINFKDYDFDGKYTLILGNIKSNEIFLKYKDKTICKVGKKGFDNLLFWRPTKENMICIEPWLNLPDFKDGVKEFADKMGICRLEKGEERTYSRKIIYFE